MALDRWLTAVRMRLRSLVRRDAAEHELDEELQFHLEQATAEYVSRGMTPAEARRAALVAMGGVDQRKEECREARGLGLLRSVVRDARLALRLLRRQPGFSIVVVITLAVGIGAMVSIVTVANWLLLRPLPGVTEPSSLVAIRLVADDLSTGASMSLEDVEIMSRGVSALNGLTGLEDMPVNVSVVSHEQTPRRLAAEFVMANYFDVIGVTVNGRAFSLEEERTPGMPPVAIVSERVARMFDGDFVGRTITINGESALVVGVVMEGFRGTKRMSQIDVWLPLAQRWIWLPPGVDRPERIGPKALIMWGLIGRRNPALASTVLQDQLRTVEQEIAATLPPTSTRFETRHFRTLETLERFFVDRDGLAGLFRVLVIAAALLLLLACANVGNAMLARATRRAGELATRLALGASRLSLARTLLIEGLLLSIAAGGLGLGVAAIVAQRLNGLAILATMPALERPAIDGFVLAASITLCIVVAIAASLSAMWSVRHASVSVLQQASRSVSFGRRRLTQVLMTLQVVISVTLLVGAALFVRSIDAMLDIDVGFERSRVQTFRLDPRRLPGEPSLSFRQDLIARLRAIPGVEAAAVAFLPPFYSGMEARITLRADDAPEGTGDVVLMLNAVHPGFFDAVGLPLVGGRDFTEADLNLSHEQMPLILPESVAKRVFGTTEVAGRFVTTWSKTRLQIVGVVRDSRQRQLTSDDTMDLAFQPHRADYQMPFITGIARVGAPDLNIWPDVRRVLAELDPSIVMFEAKSVDEGVRTEIGTQILTMRLALALGGIAVFLAAIGLASVLARALAERKKELSIRTALGATPARLAAHIGRQSVVVLLVGIPVGMLLTTWLTRYIESRLYGVSRLDPFSFAMAITIVVVIMIAASLPACRRAARVNPAVTLKEP